jgi:hypothetical protein
MNLTNGGTVNNLTDMLMSSLELKGGLEKDVIASKLLCFGVDGCNTFHGSKNGVSVQI